MKTSRWAFGLALSLIGLTAYPATTIRVLQWDGYISKNKIDDIVKMIKAETGETVELKLETITDEKMEFDRIRSGEADLVFPGVDIMDDASYNFKSKDLLLEIDPSKLKNFDALLPQFRSPKHLLYHGKQYGISFASGQTAIAYNTEKINPQSIQDLLKPEYTGKLGTLDFSPHVHEVLALALGYKGRDITNYDKLIADKAYLAVLKKWGKMATVYFTDGVDNAEQAKNLVAYIGWGFAIRTLQTSYNQKWRIMPLPGGTLVWVDSMVIPKKVGSDPKKQAILYRLMDYLISESYQKDVVLNEISCLPVNRHVLENLKPSEQKGLAHIIELKNQKDILFLPPIADVRTRNGLQQLWGDAKAGKIVAP